MEIHDKSRCTNSIDIIFNFDCKGFTGTPFLDNYPTYEYIKSGVMTTTPIPDLIDRSFYLHSNNENIAENYAQKFQKFQGENNNVFTLYSKSEFIQNAISEEEILVYILKNYININSIVDLCGIFKKM